MWRASIGIFIITKSPSKQLLVAFLITGCLIIITGHQVLRQALLQLPVVERLPPPPAAAPRRRRRRAAAIKCSDGGRQQAAAAAALRPPSKGVAMRLPLISTLPSVYHLNTLLTVCFLCWFRSYFGS